MTKPFLILACTLLAACAPSPPNAGRERRGVLVIAVDAMRGDRTSLLGYDRETTPFLDSLADESLVFERHYAAAPDALASHASILTGCDPRVAVHPAIPGISDPRLLVPSAVPRLARTFLANGYRTAAFSDSLDFSARHGLEGGFEEFLNFREGDMDPEQDFGLVGVSIRFKRWLRGLGDQEDWFAYLQVSDLERIWRQEDPANDRRFAPRPELDYVPPLAAGSNSFFAVPRRRWNQSASTLGEYEARYEGNLRECDQNLARVVTWLKSKGYWETTTLVITGTYGLGFGEAGVTLSSDTLLEGDLRTPWLVRPQRTLGIPVDQRIDQVTSAIDIAPTLIDLFGLELPPGIHGLSHKPAIFGEESDLRERAFAAGGVFEGYAVITKAEHFLRVSPGSLGSSSLFRSYFGFEKGSVEASEIPSITEAREPGTGLVLSLSEEHSERLTREGLGWFRWIREARDVLQGAEVDEETRAELLRRGLIPK